jgi:hypothetical protein
MFFPLKTLAREGNASLAKAKRSMLEGMHIRTLFASFNFCAQENVSDLKKRRLDQVRNLRAKGLILTGFIIFSHPPETVVKYSPNYVLSQ